MLNVRELVTALRIGQAEVPCMFAIACRCSRLFPLVTMIAISLVSAGEARHWRHNGYYGFYWPDRSTRGSVHLSKSSAISTYHTAVLRRNSPRKSSSAALARSAYRFACWR